MSAVQRAKRRLIEDPGTRDGDPVQIGSQRVLVINIPWYLNKPEPARPANKSEATATTVPPEAKAN